MVDLSMTQVRTRFPRQFIRSVILISCITWVLSSDDASQLDGQDRPNVILIMADDLGWKDLHCYGNERLDTPHLDRLAQQGIRFTDAYAASPVCTPTRAAVLTGQAPARLRITNHAAGHPDGFRPEGSNLTGAAWTRHLALEHVTIAERLRDAGYATGFIGKWHLSHRPRGAEGLAEVDLRPDRQGFDLNVGGCDFGGPPSYFAPYRIPTLEDAPEGEYLPDRLAEEAIAFIRAQQERPFFLCWWNYSVHYPFEAPESLVAKYEARRGPGIENPVYAAMIEGMDAAIGRVLASLDELELASRTLVIFKSDNGAFAANLEPLRGEKGYLYEGGIRVPWIVRWPGVVAPGSVCKTPIISMDVFPTILESVGLEPHPDVPLDGTSLLPLLTDSPGWEREAIFFHYPNYAFHARNRLGSAIRRGDYKLIRFYDDESLELYDLSDDISESRNLAHAQSDLASELNQQLQVWLEETGASLPARR